MRKYFIVVYEEPEPGELPPNIGNYTLSKYQEGVNPEDAVLRWAGELETQVDERNRSWYRRRALKRACVQHHDRRVPNDYRDMF